MYPGDIEGKKKQKNYTLSPKEGKSGEGKRFYMHNLREMVVTYYTYYITAWPGRHDTEQLHHHHCHYYFYVYFVVGYCPG